MQLFDLYWTATVKLSKERVGVANIIILKMNYTAYWRVFFFLPLIYTAMWNKKKWSNKKRSYTAWSEIVESVGNLGFLVEIGVTMFSIISGCQLSRLTDCWNFSCAKCSQNLTYIYGMSRLTYLSHNYFRYTNINAKKNHKLGLSAVID